MLNRNVPRYTSYPTAPHFTASVGADAYASWLRSLEGEASLSLYLHVPYCAQLCLYCGCHTKVTLRQAPIDAYAERLIREIGLIAAQIGRRRVAHLHWGGGTPSILGNSQLIRIHTALADAFNLDDVDEHAIELDPRHLTQSLARALAQIGVNRASLGVQDLTASVQKAIGRVQPFETVSAATNMLREVGITKINFDLMYGLPEQTIEDVRRTVRQVYTLAPSRLAVFGYAHVPWMKPQQRLIDAAALPGLEARHAQAAAAHATLKELGYEAIGLDHYARADDELAAAARAGQLRRNFQGYTTDRSDVLIGLGASAIGRLPMGYVQNAPDLGGYARAIEAGRLATVRGVAVSADDRLRGRIIERLMCEMSIDLTTVGEETGVAIRDYFAEELSHLTPYAREGLIEIDEERISVPEKGRPYLRILASIFDAYLPAAHARHSLAV